jgi:hypothetical protein
MKRQTYTARTPAELDRILRLLSALNIPHTWTGRTIKAKPQEARAL